MSEEGFVEEYFRGTTVSLESDGMSEIEGSLLNRHAAGFGTDTAALDFGGSLRYRKGGESHAWDPPTVLALKNFIKNTDDASYQESPGKRTAALSLSDIFWV